MVRPALSLFLHFAAALSLTASEISSQFPDYRIGDTATEDIVTPVPLVVIDPEETVALKQREAAKIPVICRYYTNAIDEAENDFRLAFASTRSNFLGAVETAFNRSKLAEMSVNSPKFHRLAVSFQRQNKSFPMSTNLAALWATGESDRVIQASLAARLREAISHPIRREVLPPDIKLGYAVRVVPMADWDDVLTLEQAEKTGTPMRRTNLLILRFVRADFQQTFPLEEKPVAKFMASFIRTNCIVDAALTLQARSRRTDALWAADRYEAGQVLVKGGQVIDKKAKAALDQMREKTAIGDLQRKVYEEQIAVRQASTRNQLILASSLGVLVVAIPVAWVLATRRRRRRRALMPVKVSNVGGGTSVVSCPTCEEDIIVATPPADAAADIRTRLVPHMARMLKEKLVQRLLSHRAQLIGTQSQAAADMAELEERLAKIHAPLQDRLRAYERRIADLEIELAQKGEENRELIKAKIQLAKEHLEAEKNRMELN